MNINNNLTENVVDKFDIESQLEHQHQIRKTKESVGMFDKTYSLEIRLYKTGKLKGSSYVKNPLRAKDLINPKVNDKYCFLWSILASLHLCDDNHPNRGSHYKQYSNELKVEGFDFTNGFKSSDVHKIEKPNNLFINMFELNFYQ